ncbi:hypothetical protein HYDPIDRAFT_118519 [Hydnomerulius pinastri MD-312]|uniref:Protein kinase domain-containing protein n=1 Tax=Hydnomerulius pinastri MD-312 TaxID=994086 RepID=A0A0C9V2E4_9AGAM|nr:hypothetical protein HYDPIDRAFT_118519 [Hydnomerulius pinastri MD-312]
MDNIDALIGTAANYLGVLAPAHAVTLAIWRAYSNVKLGRRKCLVIIRRTAYIMKTIDEELKQSGRGVTEASIERLMENLGNIEAIIQKQANMSFFKALLRFDDINLAIEEAHHFLDDCLKCFQISLLNEIFRAQTQKEKESSPKQDDIMLEEQRRKIVGNPDEALECLEVRGKEDEAMTALQKKLSTNPDKSAAETRFLQQSLSCLQVTTGRTAPKPSNWTVTQYELDYGRTIGSGGFSTVLKAEFRGTTVAVKMLKKFQMEVLEREVEIWSKLRHDHIVPFYGASIVSSPPFIVSRYMANGNLLQYLYDRPQCDRTKLVYEVLLGMRYLHGENVIHGDLKCVNVLIDDSGKACITDFGLSGVVGLTPASPKAKGIGGTLRFMAPEAIKNRALTVETDVYAFGMLIYETFTEETPFGSQPDHLVMEGRLQLSRPISREVLERGMTDDMWNLLQSCIARDPSQRPSFVTMQSRIVSIKRESRVSVALDQATRSEIKANTTTATLVDSSRAATTAKDKTYTSHSSALTKGSIPYPVKILHPCCPEVTTKYFDVEYSLSKKRELVMKVYQEEGSVLQPIHPTKGSFLSMTEGLLKCERMAGVGINTWKLSNDNVVFTSNEKAVFHFNDPTVARTWFDMQVQYARTGKVDVGGEFNVRGEWSITRNKWSRVVGNKLQRAAAIDNSPRLVPSEKAWDTVDMPKHISMDGRMATGTSFAFFMNRGSETSEWRFKTQDRKIVTEMFRRSGDYWPSIVKEDVFLNETDAQALFGAMRLALDRAANPGQDKKGPCIIC